VSGTGWVYSTNPFTLMVCKVGGTYVEMVHQLIPRLALWVYPFHLAIYLGGIAYRWLGSTRFCISNMHQFDYKD